MRGHYPGVVVALVKEVDQRTARVKLEFPWLRRGMLSYWAPIATPMTGRDRGMFLMPEVDDEALVAFEHGDFEHPFVVGFLWNGQDTPPVEQDSAQIRRLKTVSGHVLEFDDRPGQERVLLKTQAGNQIELVDLTGTITVKTTAGQEVTLSDASQEIQIVAPIGTVRVRCLNAEVNAAALLQVTAPITTFSGVVQAQTIITTSVISPAYTPGIGNLL